jgi:autophagy-related protein 18
MICELLFPSAILAVKMNRKTLVVVLEVEIYIYDISNMKLLHVIETSPNPDGMPSFLCTQFESDSSAAICALSPSSDASYLAYPSPVPSPQSPLSNAASTPPSAPAPQSGDVLLFSTRSLTVTNVLQAHKTPISFLAMNSAGTLLATASSKGTVIRVWSVPGAEKLYQFRRGTREAKIYCINFNSMSTLLAVSSAHDTVHIFKLGKEGRGGEGSGSSGGWRDDAGGMSPTPSIESREQQGDGGYEAFVDAKKKSNSVS